MTRFAAVFRSCLLAGLLPALLAGCASVGLDRHYEPPTILVPPPAPAPASAPAFEPPPAAQARPVASGQPQLRPLPLPPMDSAAPQAPPPARTAASPPSAQAPLDDPDAHLLTFTTHMSGTAAVPPNESSAAGQLDALYDASSGLLRWKAAWSDLTGPITAVQFRGPAELDQIAPPTIIWPAPFGPTYEGRAALTSQQARDLLAGRWYVNVSTTVYPAGELRGQLRQVDN
ncbi:MAG: CHRD domain-containing protein [Burkholderiaceae bacterium]|nr:CHRD domain-containing protein [Burkholderiaceae bacterium]